MSISPLRWCSSNSSASLDMTPARAAARELLSFAALAVVETLDDEFVLCSYGAIKSLARMI